MTEYISLSGQAAPALENAPMAFWRDFEWTCRKCLGADACFLDPPRGHRPYSGSSRPEDQGRVPAYPTSGTATEFQSPSLFVTVSFLILDR